MKRYYEEEEQERRKRKKERKLRPQSDDLEEAKKPISVIREEQAEDSSAKGKECLDTIENSNDLT